MNFLKAGSYCAALEVPCVARARAETTLIKCERNEDKEQRATNKEMTPSGLQGHVQGVSFCVVELNLNLNLRLLGAGAGYQPPLFSHSPGSLASKGVTGIGLIADLVRHETI